MSTNKLLKMATPLTSWRLDGRKIKGEPYTNARRERTSCHPAIIVASVSENAGGDYLYYEPKTAAANRELIIRMAQSFQAMREALEMMTPLTHYDTCAGLNWRAGSEEREEACTCGAAKARQALALAEGEVAR